jgi:hypothetical protein
VTRRLALGALIALASASALLGAAPVGAANSEPIITLNAPANNDTIGALPFSVNGVVDSHNGNFVQAVSAGMSSSDAAGHTAPNGHQNYNPAHTHETFDIPMSADFNGPYKLSVVGANQVCPLIGQCGPQNGPTVTRVIIVAVPPVAPAAMHIARTDPKQTLTWDANNAEPDMLGYILQRNSGSGQYACIAAPTFDANADHYSYVDDLTGQPNADYHYRVLAVRKADNGSAAPTCDARGTGIASAPSSVVGVHWFPVQPTSSTTSTTVKGGSSGGGGNNNGGGTSGTGAGGSKTKASPNLSALGALGTSNNLATLPGAKSNAGEIGGDSGFNQLLPFQPGSATGQNSGEEALPSEGLPAGSSGGDKNLTTKLFVAAGLLVTVLSMHVLWLKNQVDRMPLEALTPEDLPLV